jgi:hypothetical protein
MDYSAIFAGISAVCALVTLYFYRAQGKGFIWTKDPGVKLSALPSGHTQVTVEIPLWNLGTGNVRFLTLKAKKICLKNNSIEVFNTDMDEAYFPASTSIISYKSVVYNDIPSPTGNEFANQIIVFDSKMVGQLEAAELQQAINNKVQTIGEVIFILKCRYKDGSWFGSSDKETTIAMAFNGLNLTYLTAERRKQLDALFN